MSLADMRVLHDLASTSPDRLGAPEMLDAYSRARLPDICARIAGITALNRASMLSAPALRDARAAALNLLYGAPPVRRTLMQLGLGASG